MKNKETLFCSQKSRFSRNICSFILGKEPFHVYVFNSWKIIKRSACVLLCLREQNSYVKIMVFPFTINKTDLLGSVNTIIKMPLLESQNFLNESIDDNRNSYF